MKTLGTALLYGLVPAAWTFIPPLFLWLSARIGPENSTRDWLLLFSFFATPVAAVITYVGTVIVCCVLGLDKLSFARVAVFGAIGSWVVYALLLVFCFFTLQGTRWN